MVTIFWQAGFLILNFLYVTHQQLRSFMCAVHSLATQPTFDFDYEYVFYATTVLANVYSRV